MRHNVGIWIDHKTAVIVSASEDRVTTKTLESDVGPHSPQDGGGEGLIDERAPRGLARGRPRCNRYSGEKANRDPQGVLQ